MTDDDPKPDTGPEPKPTLDGVSRRAALGGLGLAGAGAIVGGAVGAVTRAAAAARPDPTGRALHKPWVPGAERFGTHEERWIATSCDCPSACGLRVRVVEGRAVRIEGNPDHPASRGGVSATALSELGNLYDGRRVKGPLVREGKELVATSWDAGLRLLAARLGELRGRGAPEELLVLTARGAGASRDLLARFCRGFGTPNLVATDEALLAQAMSATTGIAEEPVFEWQSAQYVLMLESGVFDDSCRSSFVSRVVAEIRREREGAHASLAYAGPAFDLSAYNADEWIRTSPGASGALALGICHVLVRDGLYDAGFVAQRTTGFEAFRRWILEAFPPDRAASLTGTDARTIERLARALAARRPSFVFADEKTFAHSNGLETAFAVLAVNALLGALGPLVGLGALPPLGGWPEAPLDEPARAGLVRPRIDGAGTDRFPVARSVPAAVPDALLGRRAAVVVLDAVRPSAFAQPARWRRALEAVPFVVSFAPVLDDLTEGVAHLVLPDHTLLESWEAATPSLSLAATAVSVRRPAVEPLYDTRSTGDVLIDLSRRLGEPLARALPWTSFRDALQDRLRGLHEARRGTIVAETPGTFLRRLFEAGFWADPAATRRSFERFAFQIAEAEPRWTGDEQAFPLKLLAYAPLVRAVRHGETPSWRRVVRSRPRSPNATDYASIHPDTARQIRHGETITVESPFGAVETTARLDRRMPPGCVAMPISADVMGLVSAELAPVTGHLPLAATRARITRRPR